MIVYCPHCHQAIEERPPTNDEAIELFYRRRAAGARTNLRKIADELHMSYQALLKHKQRYDAAGKWGSK